MNRSVGLLVIDVVNSNPNGNPDQDSDPRQRPDGRGMISPVSFKRKLRDLIAFKEGQVWERVVSRFDPPLTDGFDILERKDREWKEIIEEAKRGEFQVKYWDARVFGNTVLEKELKPDHIRTGVVQFGLGLSVSPISIGRETTTKLAPAEEGPSRGMAPLAFRYAEHGLYTMPYFVNPTAARKSECSERDIEVMKLVIPHAYKDTASYLRNNVQIIHAWHMEHKSPLGSCPDHELLEAMSPRRKNPADRDTPSRDRHDYDIPTELPPNLSGRILSIVDLMNVD